MPLDPHAVYVLEDKSNNFVQGRFIALGVKPLTDGLKGVTFATNTETPHRIIGDLKDVEGGTQIVDEVNIGFDNEPVVWEFTPLTMALFDEMGPTISGYAELRKAVNTEELLHTFFIENFLPDDWLEEAEKA